MQKVLLFDLDGTVRQPIKEGQIFIGSPTDQRLIDGVKETLEKYQDWVIIGITNQGGVKYGHKSLEDAIAEQQYTLKLIPQITAIYFCPDSGETCFKCDRASTYQVPNQGHGNYRKPGTGMVQAAIEDLETPPETISQILMVGDRETDKQCAEAANIVFLWANDWRII